MSDIYCRVAKIEQRQETLTENIEDIKKILEEVRDIQKNQQGFVRGVAFAVTALISLGGFVFNHFYEGR
jgi:hypothetical protein